MEQVPKPVKEARAARAAAAAEELHRAYLAGCIGEVYEVLFEQPSNGLYQGHAPNYMCVGVQGDGLHNQLIPVRITGAADGILRGEIAV